MIVCRRWHRAVYAIDVRVVCSLVGLSAVGTNDHAWYGVVWAEQRSKKKKSMPPTTTPRPGMGFFPFFISFSSTTASPTSGSEKKKLQSLGPDRFRSYFWTIDNCFFFRPFFLSFRHAHVFEISSSPLDPIRPSFVRQLSRVITLVIILFYFFSRAPRKNTHKFNRMTARDEILNARTNGHKQIHSSYTP